MKKHTSTKPGVLRSVIGWLQGSGCAVIAITMLTVANANGAISVKITKATPIQVGPSMRVVVVRPAACRDACPEWIAAEGKIAPETTAEFRRVLAAIGNRRLPVFINSVGGNVEASLAIGRLLRAHRLPVSVTRTRLEPCPQGDPGCGRASDIGVYSGTATSYGAICASACAFLIAGGERRYVSPGSLVGVHGIALVLRPMMTDVAVTSTDATGRRVEVARRRILVMPPKITDLPQATQDKLSQSIDKSRGKIAQYYQQMGVSDQLVTLAFATKQPDLHWMTRSELAETHLMTDEVGGEALVGFTPNQAPITPPSVSAYASAYAASATRPGKR